MSERKEITRSEAVEKITENLVDVIEQDSQFAFELIKEGHEGVENFSIRQLYIELIMSLGEEDIKIITSAK